MSPEPGGAKHDRRGLVSAISHGPSTDDSKFRIAFGPDPTIDPVCTIFGEVEAGLDTLKKLEDLGSADGKPTKHVAIRKATLSIR
jgi:cyclophilin family peptidyl-prolyl cis-trans isomerase